MKIYKYPKKEQWAEIVERPRLDLTKLNETVSTVLADIRERGDEAVREYELKFDKVRLSTLAVTEQEMDEAELLVSNELRDAIILAHHNIKVFHISQRFVGQKVKTQEGVTCWQKSVAIERVGLYIPGGTAPLFSTVLMLATPARIAGCKEIVLCTPPDKEGKVNPAILVAARIAGVSKIYKIGGVQAIGAMAYGTESVPKVFKIFGPGNQYVMAAKQHVSLDEVAIDMPAGPSEVCVLADETARAEFVAADLLSQAEHGIDSQVLFITTSESKLDEVHAELDRQLALLIQNAQFAFQMHFFLGIGEKHYDDQQNVENSNKHRQQKTMLAYRRLPGIFTSDDVMREYGYTSMGSVCSRLKILQDDGMVRKIRTGTDKGKYRKLG